MLIIEKKVQASKVEKYAFNLEDLLKDASLSEDIIYGLQVFSFDETQEALDEVSYALRQVDVAFIATE